MIKRFPFVGFLIAQFISLILLKIILIICNVNANYESALLTQCFFSLIIIKFVLKLPKWFLIISILLPLAIYGASHIIHWSNHVYGIIFILLILTFSHSFFERVPLYLSNNQTEIALKEIYLRYKKQNPVDLGAGLGGVSIHLDAVGIENAPLIYLIAKIRSMLLGKGKILKSNIWKYNLKNHDFVYTFLSTAIMEEIHLKAQRELNPGSILISNSFPIINKAPVEVVELNDSRNTRLYIYQY